MTEGFTGMDVGEVDLDKRDRNSQQRITQCNAGMGERRRVDQDEIDLPHGPMNGIDQFILGIGLQVGQGYGLLVGKQLQPVNDVVEGG